MYNATVYHCIYKATVTVEYCGKFVCVFSITVIRTTITGELYHSNCGEIRLLCTLVTVCHVTTVGVCVTQQKLCSCNITDCIYNTAETMCAGYYSNCACMVHG